jgi:hypothetical protein
MALIRGSQITGSVASASYAATASFVINSDASRIVSGSVTASVSPSGDIFIIKYGNQTPLTITDTGALIVSGSASDLFIIKNTQNQSILKVSQSGVVVMATQSANPTGIAPNGGILFTANNLFVGLD